MADLLSLPKSLTPQVNFAKLFQSWSFLQDSNEELPLAREKAPAFQTPSSPQLRISENYSLTKSFLQSWGVAYFWLGLLKFMIDQLGFVNPLLLRHLLDFMDNTSGTDDPLWHGTWVVLLLSHEFNTV